MSHFSSTSPTKRARGLRATLSRARGEWCDPVCVFLYLCVYIGGHCFHLFFSPDTLVTTVHVTCRRNATAKTGADMHVGSAFLSPIRVSWRGVESYTKVQTSQREAGMSALSSMRPFSKASQAEGRWQAAQRPYKECTSPEFWRKLY